MRMAHAVVVVIVIEWDAETECMPVCLVSGEGNQNALRDSKTSQNDVKNYKRHTAAVATENKNISLKMQSNIFIIGKEI